MASPTASAPVELIERLRLAHDWLEERGQRYHAESVLLASNLATAQPSVELIERAWLEIKERLNKEHAEGIISYRELKAGVNNAALMRDAALAAMSEGVDRYE